MINLEQNEKIILEIRKHWFILFAEALFLVLLIVSSIVVFFVASTTINLSKVIDWHIQLSLAAAWFLLIWIAFFIIWTDYYLDVFILTDKRIIDIEQKGIFSREISTLRLDRIQDVTVEVKGIIATLLNFGDICIQTAGEEKRFIIKEIPRPYKIKASLMAEYNEAIERTKFVKIEKETQI